MASVLRTLMMISAPSLLMTGVISFSFVFAKERMEMPVASSAFVAVTMAANLPQKLVLESSLEGVVRPAMPGCAAVAHMRVLSLEDLPGDLPNGIYLPVVAMYHGLL